MTKKLRNHRFCAAYSPSSTCASVPKNTSAMPSARQTTVSRRDAKNLISRLRGMRILHRLDELRKNFFLLLHDLRVAHQLVEPGLFTFRHNAAEDSRGPTGASVRAVHINKQRLAAFDLHGRRLRVQGVIGNRREAELSAPAI